MDNRGKEWLEGSATDRLVVSIPSDYQRAAKRIVKVDDLPYCSEVSHKITFNDDTGKLNVSADFTGKTDALKMVVLANGGTVYSNNIVAGSQVSRDIAIGSDSAISVSYTTASLNGCEYFAKVKENPLTQYVISGENGTYTASWAKNPSTTVDVIFNQNLDTIVWKANGTLLNLTGGTVAISNSKLRTITSNNHAIVTAHIGENQIGSLIAIVDNSSRSISASLSYVVNGDSMYATISEDVNVVPAHKIVRYIDGVKSTIPIGQFELIEGMLGKKIKLDVVGVNIDEDDYQETDVYATTEVTVLSDGDILYLSSGFYTVDGNTVSGKSKQVVFAVQGEPSVSEINGYSPLATPIEAQKLIPLVTGDIQFNGTSYTVDGNQYDLVDLVEKKVTYGDFEDTYTYEDSAVFSNGASAFDLVNNMSVTGKRISLVDETLDGLAIKTFPENHNIVALDFIAGFTKKTEGKTMKVSVLDSLSQELRSFSFEQGEHSTIIRYAGESGRTTSEVYGQRVHFSLLNVGDVRKIKIESVDGFYVESLIITFRK